MRTLIGFTFVVFLVTANAAHAGDQTPPTTGQPTQGAERSGTKPVTITGCVAQAGAMYRLDHALVARDPDVDTQNRPGTEASPNPAVLSYVLAGGEVKAHLGHKVEVTGTMSSDTPSKDSAGIKAAPGMKLAGTLNVKSVKMVAAVCP